MSEFLELSGASGQRYRFQRIDSPSALPAIAGNFVYVRGHGASLTVVGAGTGETLAQAGKHWTEAVREHQAEAIFVRKNVSRSDREREHRDIVEARHPPLEAPEGF